MTARSLCASRTTCWLADGVRMALSASPVRRDELRAFLRSRRARVSPADVGLPDDGARRRTPGLRREELAALAGVGVSWYTWLEQGRDIHPSPGGARCAGTRAAPRRRRAGDAVRAGAHRAAAARGLRRRRPARIADDGRALLVSLVEGLHPTPAYLLGPMTRILAWNPAASALFGSPDHLSPERRSLLWMLLVDPGEARVQPRPRGHRSQHGRPLPQPSTRSTPASPPTSEFIAELQQRSPWFAQWWGEHEVNRHPARHQDDRAPDAGDAAPAPRADRPDRGA